MPPYTSSVATTDWPSIDPGGIDVFQATLEEFATVLRQSNHTLKRALTDPRWFSGIGNAYSDEILHRARLSPFKMTQKVSADEVDRLTPPRARRLPNGSNAAAETEDGFPEKVTAFRPGHGGARPVSARLSGLRRPVQRIRYAENETDYCPGCQTGGRMLADRSLSRLLKDAWPKHLDDL